MYKFQRITVVFLMVSFFGAVIWADVKPAGIFGHHMVLQRDIDVPVWGWGKPGEAVTVEFAGQNVSTKTDADGKWMVRLKSMPASVEGREMVIRGPKNTVTLKDVLVGEVWVCSGQSNMGLQVSKCNNAKKEIAAANYPLIRHFTVIYIPNANLSKDIQGYAWFVCSPKTISNFSGVAYFFGRDLYKFLNVPVGLIHSSWGSSIAEAWTPQDTLRAKKINPDLLKLYDDSLPDYPRLRAEYYKKVTERKRLTKEGKPDPRQTDPGNKGFAKGWAKATFNDAKWKSTTLPRMCREFQKNDGAIWFRRTITIPASWADKDITLRLGEIDDYDVTYFNGSLVGATDKNTPNWWTHPRQYVVPGKLVKPGRAVIAIRVFDDMLTGGFNGRAEKMKLIGPDTSLALAGPWKYNAEVILSPHKLSGPIPPPFGPGHYNAPGAQYGGRIHPLIPFAFRGAIWFQGEGNSNRPGEYVELLSTMIGEWRSRWGQGDFPFGIVQLNNFKALQTNPNDLDNWALLREAQADVAKTLPNTGLVVTIDVGGVGGHPKNKQDVGHRLARWALATVYGKKDLTYSGPVFKSMKIKGNKVWISFDHVGGGLRAKGPELTGFVIAGADGKFHWAEAKTDGNTVVVRSKGVPAPKHVRYGMASNPPVNLYNKAGLPAVPFRTDR